MFSKIKIIEILNSEDCYIDNLILDAFIKNWKIEAIYEDENGIEYFDEQALCTIRNGLQGKPPEEKFNAPVKEEEAAEEIAQTEIQPDEIDEPEEIQVEPEVEVVQGQPVEETPEEIKQQIDEEEPVVKNSDKQEVSIDSNEIESQSANEIYEKQEIVQTENTELKNINVDISNTKINNIAEMLAKKITEEITDYLKNADILEKALQTGEFKKDNELLVDRINDVIKDNKILISKIKELDQENKRFIKVFGNIYVKK